MKHTIFTSLVVLMLALSSFGQRQNEDEAIKNIVRKTVDAQFAFDVKTLDSLLTSDYIEISPLGAVDPRPKVLGFYAPDQKPKAPGRNFAEDSEHSVRNYGKHAIVIVRLNFFVQTTGPAMQIGSMRATFVLKKEKLQWKVASAQYTGIRPPQPPKPQ